MLNSGKKIRALRDKKNKYSNSRVVRKKFSERNKKPTPPPCKLNGRSLNIEQCGYSQGFFFFIKIVMYIRDLDLIIGMKRIIDNRQYFICTNTFTINGYGIK